VAEVDDVVARAQKLLKEQHSRQKSAARFANGIAAAAAVAGLAGATLSLVTSKFDVDLLGSKAAVEARSDLDNRLVRTIGNLQSELITLQKEQAAITRLPSKDKAAAKIATLETRMDDISGRLKALEQAIQTTPEKALTMPLMRRDIDNLKESNAQGIGAIKASVDQIYDLTKWLLGALAVGVLSLVISNYFQRKAD
jgi:hypothetical protein